ncbi:MAG: C40 family peptidase [Nocardioidaceae bacterium]|nr:C40 family peptidase [Nocardioidaceae bacterium]NUS49682.1 C40 family peptidase [Nocardioidaceae bacterium]
MPTRYQPRHRAERPSPVRRAVGAGVGTGVATAVVAGSVAAAPATAAGHDGSTTRQDRIEQGLQVVRNQTGDPYAYGADGPDRFDCSGLVYYAFRKVGFDHVPRTSEDQARHMNRLEDRGDLRPGDFVFFYDGAATAENVYHVGVFAGWKDGHRVILHSPSEGKDVGRDPIWDDDWFGGTLRGLG